MIFGVSWIDIFVIAILVVFFIIGWKRGLITEITELGALVAGVFVGIFFNDIFIPVVEKYLGSFTGIEIITFLILFFIVALFFVLIGKVLTHFIKFVGLEGMNKFMGGVFGMIKVFTGSVVVGMVLFIFNNPNVNNYVAASYTGKAATFVLEKINYQEHKDEIKNIKLP